MFSHSRLCSTIACLAIVLPASFAVAAVSGSALDTNPPPQSLGSCALIAFPADQSPIGSLVTSVPGPLGPLGLNPGLRHETVAMTVSSPATCHGYTGDMYRSNLLPGTPITFTMPPNTVEFVFYAVDDFGGLTYTADATTLSGAMAQVVQVGGPFFGNCIGFGFITDDPCDPIVTIVFNSTIPPVNAPTWVGDFRICTTECQGEPDVCPGCCGKRPNFLSFGTAAIATLETAGPDVLAVFDITTQPAASWSNWFATKFIPAGLQDWSKSNLGCVFGVTLDDLGNIYLAHTTIYGDPLGISVDALGALGGVNADGAIYKIDTNTGIPSFFQSLPNNSIINCGDAASPGCGPGPDGCYPGLGNLTFSCEHEKIYVSNFEDGRIYRLDPTGAILSTWHHTTGTTSAGLPPADPNGFPPLFSATPRANRVWAVQVSSGRLYYSTWREDLDYFSPSCARVDPAQNNEIWSVALTPAGDFLPTTETLELVMPNWTGPNLLGLCNDAWSNPVSDISFSPECCMLLAERTMQGDCKSGAHVSRVLEYCRDANGQWAPSAAVFQAGNPTAESSAGGVDYDHRTSGTTAQVWYSSDAMKFPPDPLNGDPCGPYVYGLQGSPATGGTTQVNSLLLDTDQDVCSHDKFSQGDVEITCSSCATIDIDDIDCTTDGSGDYSVQFNVTNNSGRTVYYGLVPAFAKIPNDNSVTLSPNVIVFNPPLASGATTLTPIKVVVSGGDEGEEVCFNFVLADQDVQECCTTQICVVLEKCCFEIEDKTVTNVVCLSDGTVSFDWSFNLVNVSGEVLEHLFVIVQTGGITVTPGYFDLPSVANGGSVPILFTISGATPGAPFSLLITAHNGALEECCAELKTGIAPDCPPLDGSCCIPGLPCQTLTQTECENQGGVFFSVPCTADPCGTQPGACCLPQPPGCVNVGSFNECLAIGGVFVPNVVCGAQTCDSVKGACCLPTPGECEYVIELACTILGGEFHPVVQCSPVVCPAPVVCPCDFNHDNTVGFADMTLLLLAWGPAQPGTQEDKDQSGNVGFSDLTALLLAWGPCP